MVALRAHERESIGTLGWQKIGREFGGSLQAVRFLCLGLDVSLSRPDFGLHGYLFVGSEKLSTLFEVCFHLRGRSGFSYKRRLWACSS